MHKPESVLKNKRQKSLLDFEIWIDKLIPSRRPDLMIIYKKMKTWRTEGNQRKRQRDKYFDLAWELKKN